MNLEILKALNEERANRRIALVVTNTETGAQRFVKGEDVATDPLCNLLQKHIRSAKSGTEDTPDGKVFLTVHVPPPKMVIIGAVHISQALAPMAQLLDYDVTIVDPRTAFATPERFPDAKVIADWPENVLPSLGVDKFTAMVLVTHDPKIDDPALIHALERDCFYIGALGSRKTHGRRIERMKAKGFGDNALSRIHAPIGLNIGAISPPEIAVAILGEITANLRLEPKAPEMQ
jgi:xanthine dehydrogenase accessory factor